MLFFLFTSDYCTEKDHIQSNLPPRVAKGKYQKNVVEIGLSISNHPVLNRKMFVIVVTYTNLIMIHLFYICRGIVSLSAQNTKINKVRTNKKKEKGVL